MTNYCLVIIINVKEVPGAQLWIIFISVVQQPCSLPSHGSNIDIIFPCLSSFPWTKSHITRVEKCFFFFFFSKQCQNLALWDFSYRSKTAFFFSKQLWYFSYSRLSVGYNPPFFVLWNSICQRPKAQYIVEVEENPSGSIQHHKAQQNVAH